MTEPGEFRQPRQLKGSDGQLYEITVIDWVIPDSPRGAYTSQTLPPRAYEWPDGRPVRLVREDESGGWVHPDTGEVLSSAA